MLSVSNPIARLFSVTNATRLVRTSPKRTFTSPSATTASSTKLNGFFIPSSPYNRFAAASYTSNTTSLSASTATQSQKFQHPRFFSTSFLSPASTGTKIQKSSLNHSQSVRNFSHSSWRGEPHHDGYHYHATWFGRFRHYPRHRDAAAAAAKGLHGPKLDAEVHRRIRDSWHYGCNRGFHHHSVYHHRRYRPRRFLFRMMALSTFLVAIPMIMVFDAPCSTLVYVPLTVGGTGLVLMMTGRLLYFFLPVVAIGGAAMFWATTMPAANTIKDLKKILEREEKSSGYGRYSPTALSTLGNEWEIQSARPDEWFRWTFSTVPPSSSTSFSKDGEKHDPASLDKLSIRMAILDPHDQSERKAKTMKFFDKIQDSKDIRRHHIKECTEQSSEHSNKQRHECGHMLESLHVQRDGDHILVQMEEDGAKVMDQPWAKKYLALGQIVDRAASEMEAARPGMKLGEQVVLVHKNNKSNGRSEDSFWHRWSPYGDLSLRIPFDRTWVKDLSDE
ncbi:hypothetical protein FBU30_002488 [Linnemannia zychae]|nr:hypothetical protein FBU30_002488 [Linnemannia zychae]